MAPIDPQYAVALAHQTGEIYGQAEDRILEKISRRLARGITEVGWPEHKRAEIGQLRAETLEEVRRLESSGPAAAKTAVERAYETGLETARTEPGVGALGSFVGTNRQAVEKLAKETMGLVSSTHLQITRSALDIYRSVIVRASLPGVVTGVDTRREAAQRALDLFAKQGISGFVDRSGANWELSSYVEMATRTGSCHAMVEGRLQTYHAVGRTLVIVSSSPHPCEFCQPWEGQVLSIADDGTDSDLYSGAGYPSLDDATSAGLFHPNCRHDVGIYVEGLTQPYHTDPDPEGYRIVQRQRALERRVRHWKRSVAADRAWAQEDSSLQAAKRLTRSQGYLSRAQADLKQLVDQNDLKRLPYREQIVSAI